MLKTKEEIRHQITFQKYVYTKVKATEEDLYLVK